MALERFLPMILRLMDSYYLVKWATTLYTLQEDVILKEYTPHIKIAAGELVCNAR
jgi:hypothetical protein